MSICVTSFIFLIMILIRNINEKQDFVNPLSPVLREITIVGSHIYWLWIAKSLFFQTSVHFSVI